MREGLGWILLALFGGLVVYFVTRKPATGAQHVASVPPGAKVAPTVNNVTGSASAAAAGVGAAGSIAKLINTFFPPTSVTQGSVIPIADNASVISADASTNISDYPGISDTSPVVVGGIIGGLPGTPSGISSIYDTGLGTVPTLAPQDVALPDAIETGISASDVSLYA